jgi:excisionase family DNA binding protein
MARKATEVTAAVVSPPVYLSVVQAAEYLSAKVSFVRNELIYARAVPFTRLGKRIVFFRRDLDEFMEKRREQAVA